MKASLISSMASFILGTGATLVALSSWLGTSDLQEIKDAVLDYVVESEEHALTLVEDYNVTVDQANAEIQDYQVALEQANSNISQLITAYETKVTELENANQQAEQDLSDLQVKLGEMQTRLDSQYEQDMNAIIEQANTQINQANEEVADTKEDVLANIESSQVDDIVNGSSMIYENVARHELEVGGDKTVEDISSIVPTEQQGE